MADAKEYAPSPKVNLTKYITVAGQRRYCPVVVSTNGRVKPNVVLVNGIPETHPEGMYVLDWNEAGKRMRVGVGKDALEAQDAQQRQIQLLRNKGLGIHVIGESTGNTLTLANAVAEFLEDVKTQRRKPKTYAQYRIALQYLEEAIGSGKRLSDIGRRDLLKFLGYLADIKELAPRTAWTKLAVAVQLLKTNGITRLLQRGDWPKYVETEPEIYTREEIDSFLAKCNAFQHVVFEFFWMTGFREQEVQYLTWRDVDLKHQHARVAAKPEYDWEPKSWEEREVVLPDRLVKSLDAHKRRALPGVPFVFATANGRVVHNFLRQCKSVARKSGLNCGYCRNDQQTCETASICEHWFLHKFRATFATMQLQAGMDLRTVQLLMGHKDLASTMRYLKPARGKIVLDRVNQTFA